MLIVLIMFVVVVVIIIVDYVGNGVPVEVNFSDYYHDYILLKVAATSYYQLILLIMFTT